MNTAVGPGEFDIGGPLPRGLTLLEASAGTGKTFAIAALVARFVAEGVPLAALLIVTFTRMATGEPQPTFSLRGVFQISVPLFLSSATTKEPEAERWSWKRITLSW